MAKVLANISQQLGWVIPYRLGLMIREHRHKRMLDEMKAGVPAAKDGINRIARPNPTHGGRSYSREDVVDFLSSQGLDLGEVREGSVPDSSLIYSCQVIRDRVMTRPINGLHVGNFVGISLCHFTDFVRQLDENSTIVSIDPNLPHRGIPHPMDIVTRCLTRYGLENNSLILTGYSLEKSWSNDGLDRLGYNSRAEFSRECSCENQLPQLARLMSASFDFAFIDGNHDESYLAREIEVIDRLLKPGGLLILDDVNWNFGHKNIGEVYRSIDPVRFEQLGGDGRVGLVRKK